MVVSSISLSEWRKNRTLAEFGLDDPVAAKRRQVGKMNEVPKMAKEEWNKVEDNIVRFEKEGQEVIGELMAIEDNQQFDNKVYKLRDGEKNFTVFGTAVLDSRMAAIKVGQRVKIIYTGSQPNKNKSLHDVKFFEVFTLRGK